MILVDTHVVLWLALEPARISRQAAAVIEETRHTGQGLAISDMTLLEIAVIESKRRIQLSASLETLPDRGGVEICCPADHWPDLRTSDGPSSRLSERSSRPHHRSHCIGRGDFVSDRGQRYPEIQSAAHHLVSRRIYSVQSNDRVTAFFQNPYISARFGSSSSDSRFDPRTIARASRRCSCKNRPPVRRRRLRPATWFL